MLAFLVFNGVDSDGVVKKISETSSLGGHQTR